MSTLLDGALMVAAPTNLLALVAAGLFAGREERVALGATFFAVGLVVGSLTIAKIPHELPGGITQLAVALAAGVLLAAMWEAPLLPSALIWLAAGEALTWNTPPQAISVPGAVASQIGAALAGLVVFVLVAWPVSLAHKRWQHIALRIAGSWIAAIALLVLALRLRG